MKEAPLLRQLERMLQEKGDWVLMRDIKYRLIPSDYTRRAYLQRLYWQGKIERRGGPNDRAVRWIGDWDGHV